MKKGQNKTKTQLKRSSKNVNEYWLDELLEQPENHQDQPDGSVLYGYHDESEVLTTNWDGIKPKGKEKWQEIWNAVNPFNKYRKVDQVILYCSQTTVFILLFPIKYLRDYFFADKEIRRNALYNFFESSLGEILLLCLFGFLVCGIVIGWVKVIAPLFND